MAVVMLGIESDAIVDDIELQSFGSPGQSYARDARARMPGGVRERLLGHPVQAQRDVAIQRANAVGGADADVEVMMPPEFRHSVPSGRRQGPRTGGHPRCSSCERFLTSVGKPWMCVF